MAWTMYLIVAIIGRGVTAVLICAAAVLVFVEVTLLALFIRPGSVAALLRQAQAWLARNGWKRCWPIPGAGSPTWAT